MEEILSNIFAQCLLPVSIDWDLWKIISKQPPAQFQQEQQQLYQLLLSKPLLNEKHFQRFQQNHLNLYGWSLLGGRDKGDIQAYLFRPLLHRTPSFQNSKLNSVIHTYPPRGARAEPTEPKRTYPRKQGEEEIGSRELYLQTFVACRGDRYIPYDYARHMRGGNDRGHYNAFIRQNHARNHSNPITPRNPLAQFEQWKHRREQSTALLSFRTVLGNEGLNSQRGLQTMLKRQGSRKLVFVNHQRKPVNYYLRSQLKAVC